LAGTKIIYRRKYIERYHTIIPNINASEKNENALRAGVRRVFKRMVSPIHKKTEDELAKIKHLEALEVAVVIPSQNK
jgi:hypothetical protein